jgi:integrase
LAAFLAPLPLLAATPELIEEWLAGFRRAETKHAYLGDARVLYGWAAKRGIIRVDPTAQLETVRRPSPLPRPVSDDDLARAMWVADERLRLVLVLGAFAGLRRFEIASLRAEDCNQNRIVVRRGKNQKDRIIPTHPVVWLALRGHGVEQGWLFPSPSGSHIQADTVGEWVSRLFHRLGIDATLHKTRHRFGTRLAEVTNGNMLIVKEALGHTNLHSSEHYVAFDTSRMAAAIGLLPTT